MKIATVDGLTVRHEDDELETAELVRETCVRTAGLLEERWGVPAPRDCRVYVMTSWRRFLFHAAPWRWRILLAVTYPLWARRVERIWDLAGGWAQAFGDRRTAGIKPARLHRRTEGGLGQRIFHEVPDDADKVRNVTAHELTHAFTDHLALPHWLKEGIAMVAVDRLAGKATVRGETLDIYDAAVGNSAPDRASSMRRLDPDALLALYVRGYWTTRYLDEEQPELLRDLLARRHSPAELEDRLAATLGQGPQRLWDEIDARVSAHYAHAR